MNLSPVKQAEAVVYFRLLRSAGQFVRLESSPHYLFRPCSCGRFSTEPLDGSLPVDLKQTMVADIIAKYSRELGELCRLHYQT